MQNPGVQEPRVQKPRVQKPCVLVFAGSDPSGGAGIQADIEAIAAQGAHALPIITALTVQDNDRVFAVHPVDAAIMLHQADTLARKIPIAAIKIGIVASRVNAEAIAGWIRRYKQLQQQQHPEAPGIEVILDPVLGSGHGDALAVENAVYALQPLLEVATLICPNLPEAAVLCPAAQGLEQQAGQLVALGPTDVLIKGGHGTDSMVTNTWFHAASSVPEPVAVTLTGDPLPAELTCLSWQWPRLEGAFHGSGCTLASAIAGQRATGIMLEQALLAAQQYCQQTLAQSYSISSGQRIPERVVLKPFRCF